MGVFFGLPILTGGVGYEAPLNELFFFCITFLVIRKIKIEPLLKGC